MYFHLADFAVLSRDLFITKSFALSRDNFAVRIDDCFPFPKLAWKGILFLWIMLNTVSSLVFECGRRKTNLSTLKSKLYLGCPTAALNVRLLIPNNIHEKIFLIIFINYLRILPPRLRYVLCHSLLENQQMILQLISFSKVKVKLKWSTNTAHKMKFSI